MFADVRRRPDYGLSRRKQGFESPRERQGFQRLNRCRSDARDAQQLLVSVHARSMIAARYRRRGLSPAISRTVASPSI